MKQIDIKGLGDLEEAAEQILEAIPPDAVVAFYGQMGAGKTTLIREMCRQLGVTDPVTSPTFALVNEYHAEGGRPVYHFDFYRINKVEEAYDFGYEEYFYGGSLCLVEWPEKIEELLPDDCVKIGIEITGDNSRRVTVGE
ncbi:MAG: tRNA (adenosine(37)-N6)-threonylcarbamoyltransferase complex ATPase subunit type 1 TsaE [Rikenellaceae bacterium]|nr:tRNA (adenosine(37)-N6)-threonylcarbamoyltransferase complex ATPase subunit type 1 TsaE [Rikenellaceae bacterium]